MHVRLILASVMGVVALLAMDPVAAAQPRVAADSQTADMRAAGAISRSRCDPTDHYWLVKRASTKRIATYRGMPFYNNTQDNATKYKSATVTRTHSETHHWEVGGSGGIDLKVWSAKVEGKYGHDSVSSVAKSTTEGTTITIRPRYSGWFQLNVYKVRYRVLRYHRTPICDRVTDGVLIWLDKAAEGEGKTRRGRHPF